MSHARTQIRNAIVSALSNLTTTGSNVFVGKVSAFADSQLPGLNIMTLEEELDTESSGGSHSGADARQLRVEIQIKAKQEDGLLAALDGIEVEIHDAIMTDDSLGGKVKRMKLVGSRVELDEEEKNIGTLISTWGCYYLHVAGDLETLA